MRKPFYKNTKIFFSFSLIFFLLILSNYIINLHILQSMISDQQTNTIKGASKRISKWLNQKINSMEVIKSFIKDIDHTKHVKDIENILLQSKEVASFANVYVGYEDDTTLSGLSWNRPDNYITIARPWYIKTQVNKQITITDPYFDVGFKKVVVAICTPFLEKNKKQGVVCGILPLNDIRNEILDIPLPYDGIAFLIDSYGRILLHPDEKQQLKNSFYSFPTENKMTKVNNELDSYIFSHDHINQSNWFIIAQLNKSSVYKKINLQLLVNLTIYAISVLVFIILNVIYQNRQNISDEKLKKTETLLNHFIDFADRGILIADSTNKILFFNPSFTEYLKIDKKDVEDTFLNYENNLFKIFPLEFSIEIYNKIKKVKALKQTVEVDIIHKESEKYFHITILPVLSSDKTYQGLILFFQDVTLKEKGKIYKKEQEDILFQQAKMTDLGGMIAAISHQWRQPLNSLSIMVGNLLQFKQMGHLTDEIFEENLKHSMVNIHYLADTIETFRNFYKTSKKAETFEINKAINEVFYILSPHFKNLGIELEIKVVEAETLKCLNYKNEFQQVIANLIHNAKDAIVDCKKCPKKIIIEIFLEEEIFYIRVKDYGNGISPKIRNNLFQAFQTTKKQKGTGKGLYLSRLIAKKKLDGSLSISNYENPTEFLLTLPLKRKEEND